MSHESAKCKKLHILFFGVIKRHYGKCRKPPTEVNCSFVALYFFQDKSELYSAGYQNYICALMSIELLMAVRVQTGCFYFLVLMRFIFYSFQADTEGGKCLKKSTNPHFILDIIIHLFHCCLSFLSLSYCSSFCPAAAPPDKPPRLTAQVTISCHFCVVISFQVTPKTI